MSPFGPVKKKKKKKKKVYIGNRAGAKSSQSVTSHFIVKRYNQFKLKKEKKINDQAELILFLFKIRGVGGMEGIKEKKKKKGRSIGSDRREEENNYFKKKMIGIADR